MKVGKDYSWWVSFKWYYEYYNEDERCWRWAEDSHACKFNCRKKDIKKEVKKWIFEDLGMSYDEVRNVKATIVDTYIALSTGL